MTRRQARIIGATEITNGARSSIPSGTPSVRSWSRWTRFTWRRGRPCGGARTRPPWRIHFPICWTAVTFVKSLRSNRAGHRPPSREGALPPWKEGGSGSNRARRRCL